MMIVYKLKTEMLSQITIIKFYTTFGAPVLNYGAETWTHGWWNTTSHIWKQNSTKHFRTVYEDGWQQRYKHEQIGNGRNIVAELINRANDKCPPNKSITQRPKVRRNEDGKKIKIVDRNWAASYPHSPSTNACCRCVQPGSVLHVKRSDRYQRCQM